MSEEKIVITEAMLIAGRAAYSGCMFLEPEPEVKFYRKVGDEYIEIENPSQELKAMFSIPPGGGKTACVVTEDNIPESIKDLMIPCLEGAVFITEGVNASIIEAYRGGKESK